LIRKLAWRLLSIAFLAVIGCFFAFMLGYFGPGDPVRNILGETWNTPYQYEQLRHELGLDRNVFVQFGDFMWSAVHGDLGVSWQRGQPVSTLIWDGISITLPLTLAAALLTALVGIPLGLIAAFKHNTVLDRAIVLSTITAHAVPAYVMAPMLLVLLVLQAGWLPVTLGWPGLFSTGAVIPLVTLALGPLVFIVRQTRNSVLEVLSEDHIRTAHAMGLPRRVILLHHIIPNALGPVINQTGLIFGGLLISSIFVESIFNIPGFGSLLFNAALNQDYPLLIGTTVCAMVIISIAYFVTDVVQALVDPRIRLS
jgi:ABC-type dipeptide/oligopeptide/nickel transport system permease component